VDYKSRPANIIVNIGPEVIMERRVLPERPADTGKISSELVFVRLELQLKFPPKGGVRLPAKWRGGVSTQCPRQVPGFHSGHLAQVCNSSPNPFLLLPRGRNRTGRRF